MGAFTAAPSLAHAQGSATVTPFFIFDGGSDGAQPQAGLVLGSDGNFYGTTSNGGASDDGTVFQLTPAGALTIIHSFSGSDGRAPKSELVLGSDGNFYGTTGGVRFSGGSTVFRITPAGVLTTLYTFPIDDGDPFISGLVEGNDGYFYVFSTGKVISK